MILIHWQWIYCNLGRILGSFPNEYRLQHDISHGKNVILNRNHVDATNRSDFTDQSTILSEEWRWLETQKDDRQIDVPSEMQHSDHLFSDKRTRIDFEETLDYDDAVLVLTPNLNFLVASLLHCWRAQLSTGGLEPSAYLTLQSRQDGTSRKRPYSPCMNDPEGISDEIPPDPLGQPSPRRWHDHCHGEAMLRKVTLQLHFSKFYDSPPENQQNLKSSWSFGGELQPQRLSETSNSARPQPFSSSFKIIHVNFS